MSGILNLLGVGIIRASGLLRSISLSYFSNSMKSKTSKKADNKGGVEISMPGQSRDAQDQPILNAKNTGKRRGAVKNPPSDAPPMEAKGEAKEKSDAKAKEAKASKKAEQSPKAKGQTKVRVVKAAVTEADIDKANAETANAIVNYDPAMRDAHAYGHDTLASKVVLSLKEYVALIGAHPDSYALLIIQRGGVAIPPLRKVWDKTASILGLSTIPGRREYSEADCKAIRTFYNALKSANAKFLASVKANDTAKSTLRGSRSEKDNGEVTYKFRVTETTAVSASKLALAGGSGVFAGLHDTTNRLVLNVAKSHVFNPVAMVAKPDPARFAIWRKAWTLGDKLPVYCDGHHAAKMMADTVTSLEAFNKFSEWAKAYNAKMEKAKKAKQSATA